MESISILKSIITEDAKTYIVGGFIRNYLLNKDLNDIDLIVMSNVKKVVKKYVKQTNFKSITLDQKRNIYRVITDQNLFIDFSSPVSQDLYQDLGCRDFTINSMAVNLSDVKRKDSKIYMEKEDIIDPYDGIMDLDKKIIRMVNDTFIKEDPLRIIRAYRFSNNLNFDIENKTKQVINEDLKLLPEVKNERIKDELIKLFNQNLIPKRFKGFLSTEIVEILFNFKTYRSSVNKRELISKLKYNSRYDLLEKIEMKNYLINLIIFFLIPIKRGDTSLRNINNLLIDYTFNKKEVKLMIDYLYTLREVIKNHKIYKENEALIYNRLFHKQTDIDNLRYLVSLFCYSLKQSKECESINEIIKKLNRMRNNTQNKLINGNDIKKIFNLKEGKVIGEILREIEKKQALKKLNTRQEVINYIRSRINKYNKN